MRRIVLKWIDEPKFNPAMPYKRKINVHLYRRFYEFERKKDAIDFLAKANEAVNNLIFDTLKVCANVYEVYRIAHYSGMDPVNLAHIEFHANHIFKDMPEQKLHYYPIQHTYRLREELTEVLNLVAAWWEARKNYDNLKQCRAIQRGMENSFAAFEKLA